MSSLDVTSIFLIALGLSADCFAVALSGSIALKSCTRLHVFRTSLTFGVFQAFMPVLGWLAGLTLVNVIEDYDHWIAFGLLALVGGRMIWESLGSKENGRRLDITRGLTLITLAVATSIDALAIGLTFAFLEVNIALAVSIIGVTAFLVTMISFIAGRKLGSMVGKRAEVIGGVILIGIGLRILLTHLFG